MHKLLILLALISLTACTGVVRYPNYHKMKGTYNVVGFTVDNADSLNVYQLHPNHLNSIRIAENNQRSGTIHVTLYSANGDVLSGSGWASEAPSLEFSDDYMNYYGPLDRSSHYNVTQLLETSMIISTNYNGKMYRIALSE